MNLARLGVQQSLGILLSRPIELELWVTPPHSVFMCMLEIQIQALLFVWKVPSPMATSTASQIHS